MVSSSEKEIQNEHMKHRCYFILLMCIISSYTWYNYSLFSPIDNRPLTPFYVNGLVFLFYLLWDTYYMILSQYSTLLHRLDLIIHHIMSFIVTASSINTNTLQMSNYMIIECISLMNYIWKDNQSLLKVFRTCCIVFVRIPLSLWFWLYYNPMVIYPFWKATLTNDHYRYMKTLYCFSIFFVFYDLYMLWKMYMPKHEHCCSDQINNTVPENTV
jgi:hypothetical protein